MTAVLGFAAIAFALIAVPGPDWAYVLAAGARDHVVVPAVVGVMAGYAVITAVLVVGVGPLIAAVPLALTALTTVGAVYLLYLGVRTLRAPAPDAGDVAPAALASSRGGYFARGIAVSGLNPKGLLLFLAVLPQFTRAAGGWPLPAQFAVLGGVYISITALFYLPLGFTAHRVLGARPRVAQLTTRIAGIAMILVGLALIAERAVQAVA